MFLIRRTFFFKSVNNSQTHHKRWHSFVIKNW